MLSFSSPSLAVLAILSTLHFSCLASPYTRTTLWNQGFAIITSSCNPTQSKNVNQTQNLSDAWNSVQALTAAGLNALKSPTQPPYNYFFRPEDMDYVTHTLQNLQKLSQDPNAFLAKGDDARSKYLELTCSDDTLCMRDDQWGAAIYTGGATVNSWTVTLCDYGLNSLERNRPPCTNGVGVPSLGWLIIKYLVQMWSFVAETGDDAIGPVACHKLVTGTGGDPTKNSESFAYFLEWALDLGYGERPGLTMGGAPKVETCLGNWHVHPQDALPTWARQGITN
ncbi:MAG: hypothetical protein L6R41_004355 [Letrouitia leprolyta]|nr:MAG: hypothetical protein L6R41_004355 [Letrouitia leprolyta]